MSFGKSLELFFISGRPDGMLTAKVFNWTGHVLKAPRTQIKEALERPEADYTGIYLLIGAKDDLPFAYVGEAEVISERIKTHDLKKDWWDQLILISTSANELNKAHVKYLESKIIKLAHAANSFELDNVNTPAEPKLSEAAVANMEEFIDVLKLVLPAIGIPLLQGKVVQSSMALKQSPAGDQTPLFRLFNKKNGISARARLLPEGFVVLAKSQVRRTWEGAMMNYAKLHAKLVADGVIDITEEPAVFLADYAFDSPSAAAAVCQGRSANGRLDWKVDVTQMTYAEWEKSTLEVKT
jgi:hypothetical protein